MSVKPPQPLVFDPGLCRCCGTLKKCRVLNEEYEHSGKKEVYADMILDCFSLMLSHLDGTASERLVCATCVVRLREACSFRRQVLTCEEAFLQIRMCDADAGFDSEGIKHLDLEVVKAEDIDTPGVTPDVTPDTPDDLPANDDSDENDKVNVVKLEILTESEDDVPLSRRTSGKDGKAKKKKNSKTAKKPKPGTEPGTANSGAATNTTAPVPVETNIEKTAKLVSMKKLQQKHREEDQAYITQTNILNIVEFSYACPFKCRHNNLICYYCGFTCTDSEEIRVHTDKNHNPKKFKLVECKKIVKIDFTRIDCRLCDTKIDDLEEFKRHISNEHGKKYYFHAKEPILPFRLTKQELKCCLCEQKFPYFHALNKHMNVHYRNYVCDSCGLGFVDKGRFIMHQQRHNSGDFPCETCGKVFKAQYNRDLHIDRVHKKKGRVYCPKCDIKLMSYPQKLKHLVEVHGEAPLSFDCNLCEKVFSKRRTLTTHLRKDHLKDFRYECQFCGQKFFTRFALNNHMPTHTGERNFKCKVCEKTYPRLKTLKDHMRIHTNDRRYRCHICGQAFIQNCSLKGHLKSQHPEYG